MRQFLHVMHLFIASMRGPFRCTLWLRGTFRLGIPWCLCTLLIHDKTKKVKKSAETAQKSDSDTVKNQYGKQCARILAQRYAISDVHTTQRGDLQNRQPGSAQRV